MMYVRLTRAVKAIMIACFVAFVVQNTADQFFGGNLLSIFALVPNGFLLEFRFWQIFTYPFLHGDVMHLFLNLLMLAFIGGELEAVWGTPRFLRFYFFCSTVAGVLYLLLQVMVWGGSGLYTPMVGASGAIYGLLMAYGLLFGERVLLFMLLFPMKAKYFVWILAGVEFMTTVFSGRGGLSSAAHLGGMAAGFGYLWVAAAARVRKKQAAQASGSAFTRRKKKKKNHLRLVSPKDAEPGDDDDINRGPKTWH